MIVQVEFHLACSLLRFLQEDQQTSPNTIQVYVTTGAEAPLGVDDNG